MYQWLNMAQYRAYDMCNVYKLCINGRICPNTVYTTCAMFMSEV